MKKSLLINVILTIMTLCMLTLPASADQLADIKTSGTLRFGTASGYVPFVFYDSSENLTGIDVELIKEVGKRIGVEVKVIDLAFDGLIDAVNIGQVDLIGGALSKNDERARVIDFTRVYYAGNGQVIARAGATIPATVNGESFRGSKIAVQRGTSFDQWISTNLIGGGFITSKDIFEYAKVSDAVKALDDQVVNYVFLDQDVYEKQYQNSGKYVLFSDGFITESYAFAAAKGSDLVAEVNNQLTAMIKDGTAQNIANKFFQINFDDANHNINRPSNIVTPQPVIIPTSAPRPASCVNAMSFVSDVTITDGHEVKPGETFTKTWRIYNNGSCTWDTGYYIGYASGDQMGGQGGYVSRPVAPGTSYDISVNMKAPNGDGTYKGYWQMVSSQRQAFGQTIWCKVRVRGGSPQPVNPTPVPPMPGPVYPTQAPDPGPAIYSFSASDYEGDTDQCVDFYYSVDFAMGVDIYVDGGEIYSGYGPNGSTRFCDWGNEGTHSVKLHAWNNNGEEYAQFSYYASFWIDPVYPDEDPVIYDPVYPDENNEEIYYDEDFIDWEEPAVG